jgi:outer membrane protein assembly factor BamB
VLADGVVYVDDQQGDLSGLAQATGCRAWSDTQGLAQLDGTGNLVVAGGTIYIGATAYQIDRQPSSCRIT